MVTPVEDPPITVANDCNFIINSDLFMSLILMIGQCPDRAASINIERLIQEKMGLAQFFRLSCVECKWYIKFCASKECCRTDPTSGRKPYEVNRRAIVAFHENGQGRLCWYDDRILLSLEKRQWQKPLFMIITAAYIMLMWKILINL